jgi:large subunit ribosomal protein L6
MSRIGKQPVSVPSGVTVSIEGQTVKVKGPKGELQSLLLDLVDVSQSDGEVKVTPRADSIPARAAWGLSRTLIANMVTGVTTGFTKSLEITGVGFRAAVQGNALQLNLGYSHDVSYPIPEGISITTPRPTSVVVSGIDKQQVGQVAAEIRQWRKPEPDKGKGVRYAGELIYRKQGKKK